MFCGVRTVRQGRAGIGLAPEGALGVTASVNMRVPLPMFSLLFAGSWLAPALAAQGTVTVHLTDYAAVPQSGVLINSTDNAVYVARVNFLREEPGGGLVN